MDDKGVVIYDIETLKGLFIYTDLNVDTLAVNKFIICKEKNQLIELLNYLDNVKGMVGYNNLSFDYPVLHYILRLEDNLLKLSGNDVSILIYDEAQRIITTRKNKDSSKNYTSIRPKEVKIHQLDLFKIWHYDNHAKSTSLKALEVGINYPNVMEMPMSHTKEEFTIEEIDEVLAYNLNDVKATYEFYKITLKYDKIGLRKSILNKYGLNCLNWNNGKIGEELILKLYCDKTGKNPYEVRELRSERLKMALKDCIPPNISFKSTEFNLVLDWFRQLEINTTKDDVGYSIPFKKVMYHFGLGGIHAAIEPGLYKSDDHYIIKTCDVASLHPNLPIAFGFYPEHLGPEFIDVYKDGIVGVRLAEKAKSKEEQDKSIIDGFKEAANIPYGKSSSKYSFLYDPLYTMKTTVASQLVLVMLCERLSEIPNSQILMVNTDGIEIKIPREQEHKYLGICKQWEQDNKRLVLEFDEYEKMWIRDINDYGCLSVKGKIKNKGSFEVDKMIGNEPAYYKNNSFKIVPLAIQEFFTKGIMIEDTIKNHTDIYDFCGRQKFKGDDYGVTRFILDDKIFEKQEQKVTRYYISNNGSTFIKRYAKGSDELINKGYQIKIFNKFEKKRWDDYNINYQFYITQAMKEIDIILDNQLELQFD